MIVLNVVDPGRVVIIPFTRATIPWNWGWYTDPSLWSIPSALVIASIVLFKKWIPLSELKRLGMPNLGITSQHRNLAAAQASSFTVVVASTFLLSFLLFYWPPCLPNPSLCAGKGPLVLVYA